MKIDREIEQLAAKVTPHNEYPHDGRGSCDTCNGVAEAMQQLVTRRGKVQAGDVKALRAEVVRLKMGREAARDLLQRAVGLLELHDIHGAVREFLDGAAKPEAPPVRRDLDDAEADAMAEAYETVLMGSSLDGRDLDREAIRAAWRAAPHGVVPPEPDIEAAAVGPDMPKNFVTNEMVDELWRHLPEWMTDGSVVQPAPLKGRLFGGLDAALRDNWRRLAAEVLRAAKVLPPEPPKPEPWSAVRDGVIWVRARRHQNCTLHRPNEQPNDTAVVQNAIGDRAACTDCARRDGIPLPPEVLP